MNTPHHQRGIALLVAIMLVAIGTILAASIAFKSAMAARRGIASLSFEQSVRVAQGAEALAAYALRDDTNETDDYSEFWAQPLPPTEITPGVTLEARVDDLQGRFNLNSLVDEQGNLDVRSRNAFQRLLQAVGLETKWADQMVDWIDGDSNENGFDGLEDGGTTGQKPPYRVANARITSVSELLALPGFGRERYQKLSAYVSALPYKAPLNTCTASGVVLDAMMAEGYSEFSVPETLERNRKEGCYPTAEQYKQIYVVQNPATGEDEGARQKWLNSHFDQKSDYYRLTSVVTLGGSDFALYSLLQKPGVSGSQGKVHVVQRSFTPD
jgi:general secretion pathway protein K